MDAKKKLRLERTFDAPVERLWAAWTDPQLYAQWLNPAPFDLVIHEFDVRPGGKVRFDMPQPDGNRNPQEGVFHVLERNRRLVTGTADRSFLLEVTFEPVGTRTRLVIEATGVPPDWHEAATKGWGASLDKLARLVGPSAGASGTADREIVLSREYAAPPERVWEAWTDREQVARWWGPDGFRTTTLEMDVRPGGLWRFTMHGPDGTDYPNWARYEEVVPPKRLVYAHGGSDPVKPDFNVTVTFDDLGKGRTRVTLRSLFPSKEARDFVVREYHAVEGGKQTLARLAEHLATPGSG